MKPEKMLNAARAALLLAAALGSPAIASPSEDLSALIHASLTEKIAEAEIRIPSLEKICAQKPLSDYSSFKRVRLVEDRPNGVALFEVNGAGPDGVDRSDLVQTPYSAWKKIAVPLKRIYPHTALKNEDFKAVEVNVATGAQREYRGAMLSATTDFSGLQTRQTLVEGQFVPVNAVEKQPDVRKGDVVQLDLISGDLQLSTQATATEPASIGDRVHVITTKSKREVVGILREDRSVEVQL